ncbi:AAA family ATPase, partial [Candidatus Gottesmanbacteria bacterium]|nr:AAA family ATPase [Candidatus Gottesmanbacteria bacterium]
DASNILKPSLARGELQAIGTTTVTEYRKYIEKDPALERRFQPVLVNEPTTEVAIQMLTALRDKYEAFHRVKISDAAIEEAVKLSQRYIGDRFLPDKAVDLIDEGAASVRLPAISLPEEIKDTQEKIKRLQVETQDVQKSNDHLQMEKISRETEELNKKLTNLEEQYQIKKSTTTNTVTPDIIADIVSRWTNIPVSRLSESESAKLIDLENIIHKRLIDQEEAVTSVAEAVRRGRAGLKSNKRPIGSFIFMGPTGVGKTELAKALAEILFGSEEMMVRLDMTEYMEKHEVAKLIGAPPGYVGYDEGGQLTEAVRRRPYSVVLFDEIEKAHPDVFNILIQLLDDGRLTDNKGHTISFKNTIVICTSNLGSGIIQEELSESSRLKAQSSQPKADQPMAENPQVKTQNDDVNSVNSSPTPPMAEESEKLGQQSEDEETVFNHMVGRLMEELKKFFRPELLNRFDEVVVFRPLSREHMKEIVALQIKGLIKLLEEKNMRIKVTDEASAYLAKEGYDPVFGARPLRRALQRLVENQLSSLIIKGELKEDETVSVQVKDNELSFNVEGHIKDQIQTNTSPSLPDNPLPVVEPKTTDDSSATPPKVQLADLLSASGEEQTDNFPVKQPSPTL